MRRVTYCALCGKPFNWLVVDGERVPDLWSRWGDPDDYIYCSPECCYITVAGRAKQLKKSDKLQ
jgi:hypothetical protein